MISVLCVLCKVNLSKDTNKLENSIICLKTKFPGHGWILDPRILK